MQLTDVISAIKAGRLRISDHADEEAQSDKIDYEDIIEAVFSGEIIERYPDDKPYPSCLVYGKTSKGDPIHTVWGYNDVNRWAVLITVYRPDPERWINWRKRRKENDSI